jgi:hypothetical protein
MKAGVFIRSDCYLSNVIRSNMWQKNNGYIHSLLSLWRLSTTNA